MTKTKTITLRHIERWEPGASVHRNVYVVIKITDSLEFNPGQELAYRQAQDLCEASGWKVTIIGQEGI